MIDTPSSILLIDGQWCDADSGRTVDVINPANEETLLSVAYGVDEVKRRFPVKTLIAFTSLGVFIYGGIGLVCLLLGANFLDYGILPITAPRSMGMLGIEIGVGITVMAALTSIFYDLLTFE